MPDKFRNKYRISSARLQAWDYSSCGSYFVTVCTQKKEHFFGQIINDLMHLNDTGKIVEQEWLKTPLIRVDMNVELGEFVVMPNHFHGILIIGANRYNLPPRRDAMHGVSNLNTVGNMDDISIMNGDVGGDAMHRVSTIAGSNKFDPQSKNLSSIVRGFKSAVTIQARQSGNAAFGWQPLFHEHIISNTASFERIQNYIIHNPSNWKADKFYN